MPELKPLVTGLALGESLGGTKTVSVVLGLGGAGGHRC
jgi:hypothetical protein